MPNTAETLICNTGPLIALAKIEHLPLLQKLFSRMLVPSAVWQELTQSQRLPEAAWLQPQLLGLEIVETLPPIDPLLIAQLDAGEAAVLTLARHTPASVALLDERKARHIAEVIYQQPILGTGGLFLRAKQQGLVTQIRPLFESLLAQGYYLSDRLIDRICAEANELEVRQKRARYRVLPRFDHHLPTARI